MQTIEHQLNKMQVDLQLQSVILSVLAATKDIAFKVSQGALSGILGATDNENVQGETQKKLDVIANQLLLDELVKNPYVRAVASEEEDLPVACTAQAPFLVAFDPLDGSSNIDINGQIGTIFTILPAAENSGSHQPQALEKEYYQAGRNQLCAGYVLYGPSATLVIALQGQIHEFTLDRIKWEYCLTKSDLRLPADTKEFSANMSNFFYWSEHFQNYVRSVIRPNEKDSKFNMRWNGAMVGDVHRIISRGGIFIFPSDNKNPKQPAKLRVLYEAFPMAFLIEQAGGKAFSETGPIMDIALNELHQRTPVILGDGGLVKDCLN